MRPKYVVIQMCPNMLHVADINVFEDEKEMNEFVGFQKDNIYSIEVYARRHKPPWYELMLDIVK